MFILYIMSVKICEMLSKKTFSVILGLVKNLCKLAVELIYPFQIDPYLANVPILYPSKHKKTKGFRRLLCIYRGYKMGTLARYMLEKIVKVVLVWNKFCCRVRILGQTITFFAVGNLLWFYFDHVEQQPFVECKPLEHILVNNVQFHAFYLVQFENGQLTEEGRKLTKFKYLRSKVANSNKRMLV